MPKFGLVVFTEFVSGWLGVVVKRLPVAFEGGFKAVRRGIINNFCCMNICKNTHFCVVLCAKHR